MRRQPHLFRFTVWVGPLPPEPGEEWWIEVRAWNLLDAVREVEKAMTAGPDGTLAPRHRPEEEDE